MKSFELLSAAATTSHVTSRQIYPPPSSRYHDQRRQDGGRVTGDSWPASLWADRSVLAGRLG